MTKAKRATRAEPEPIDAELLARELVRSLRGRRSQTALSRKLGYRSNVVYTWESGQRWPAASDFLRAAGKVGVDVPAALQRFFPAGCPALAALDPATPEGVAALLGELRGSRVLRTLARQVGVSRVALAAWLRGEGQPRLPELLRLVAVCSLRLLDFVALFVDPDALSSTRRAWENLEAQRRVAYELPWSHAILRLLETREYRALPRHDSQWIATRLGVPLAMVEVCLRALRAAGQVRRTKQRYAPSSVLTVDTLPSREHSRALKRF